MAAAEVVAALRGAPMDRLPEEVTEWVHARRRAYRAELDELALAAIERARSNSEAQELWEEAEDGEQWFAELRKLEERLRLL